MGGGDVIYIIFMRLLVVVQMWVRRLKVGKVGDFGSNTKLRMGEGVITKL